MPSLFEAYLAGEARAFYARHVQLPEERARAVELSARPCAPRLLASLERQQAHARPSPARARALDALARGACAVVTGQQVGLFLGPLFTLYKAASAVRLAQLLQAQTGRPAVPIFWLQTEDHDLPEIARCVLPRRDEAPLEVAPEIDAHNRVSIAQLHLPAAISGCLEQLKLELHGLPHAEQHLARLARHYQPGRGWGEAFAGLLSELFEPEGLLVLDPRDPTIAALAAPIHQAALERSDALGAALLEQSAALRREGFEPTVHVRADSPLSFFHPQGAAGPRTRLTKQGEHFSAQEPGHAARSYELPELSAQLARDPLCFSSSALLRPIVQDSLLPTAAYVGGPAELAYFAQLPPLYAAFGLPLTLVAPRARLRLIEPAAARLLRRLALQAADAAQSEPELLARVSPAPASAPAPEDFERGLSERLQAALNEALRALPEATQRKLAPQLDKTRAKLRLTCHKLGRSYAGARLRHDAQRVWQVRRLRALLFPGGEPQERVFGLPYFAARYGDRALVERILAAIDPCAAPTTELLL